MRNVHDFSDFFFAVLRAPWIKPRRMHPTFMRGTSNLIVSEIEVQVARDPELNPGNHSTLTLVFNTVYLVILVLVIFGTIAALPT